MLKRRRLRVTGIVQGVGFRPAVWRWAAGLGLAGSVRNAGSDVVIEIEGEERLLDSFLARLRSGAPPRAVVRSIAAEELEPAGLTDFAIEASGGGSTVRQIPPDGATCDECLAEIRDPGARRFRYPFTNCTDCGPRYTIVTDLPYDRPRTSMAGFPLCEACAREYADPRDRRFHAQPIACPRCGPAVRFVEQGIEAQGAEAIARTAEALRAGQIVAIKGLGGYHLACLAESERAVRLLRERKGREAKPFAVMVRDLAEAERLAVTDAVSRRLLAGPEKPIVLLPRLEGRLPEALAPGLRQIGLLLPYTPLHAILLDEIRRPLVMTSGNLSDDPIACDESDAVSRLGSLADAFLHHDRPIVRRCEDSVCSVVAGKPAVLRRARGFAPAPIPVTRRSERVILAVGGHLKNTFCYLKDRMAIVSPHVGDLHHRSAFEQFCRDVDDVGRLLGAAPELVAYDLHPDYLATGFALRLPLPGIGVQHHHAHIAACLAENGEEGPAIGIAFDGLGMGLGGELWGGEFLVASCAEFTRAGWIEPLLLAGGERANRQAWRVAAACLWELGGADRLAADAAFFAGRDIEGLSAILARRLNCIPITSAGRLFDCVAALAGVCLESTYEGEAPLRLEQLYSAGAPGPDYELAVTGSAPPFIVGWRELAARVVEDRRRGADPGLIASRFHRGLAQACREVCLRLRESTGIALVALSGGVFHNKVFTELLAERLAAAGFTVLLHHEVPAGDGGLSLGQAVIADRKART